jgi:hypothetical protein
MSLISGRGADVSSFRPTILSQMLAAAISVGRSISPHGAFEPKYAVMTSPL